MNCSDIGESIAEKATDASTIKTNVEFMCWTILIPILCVFGIVGNIVNMTIMTRHRIQKRIDCLEKTAYMGLTALALSDMFYCLVLLPRGFIVQGLFYRSRGFALFYHVYYQTVINIFIMSSTGLTVVMAIARYLAVCRPLHARQILSLHCTKVTLVIVFMVSIIFNLPVLWTLDVHAVDCADTSEKIYFIIPGVIMSNDTNIHLRNIGHSYRFLWAVFGNFIPLALLIVCNIGLLRSLRRSQQERDMLNARGGLLRKEHHRLTLTLVVIIIMFCLLVAPHEITHFVLEISNKDGHSSGTSFYMTEILAVILDLLQAINFSTNFILYCAVNTVFRNVIRKWLYNCNPKHTCCMTPYKFYSQSQTSTTCASVPMTEVTSDV